MLICCILCLLFVNHFKAGLALTIIMLVGIIFWVQSEEADINSVISFCLFVYPLLPRFWGIKLGGGIPVLHASRILSLIIILFLIRNKLFVSYYRDFFKADIFTKPIILIFISLLLTSFVSDNKPSTIFFLVSFIIETILLPVIIFSTYKTEEDIERLVSIIVYPAIILVIIGFIEYYAEYNIYSILGDYETEEFEISLRSEILRIRGSHSHPIAFGSYFALVLPFVFYKFKDKIIPLLITSLLIFIVITKTDSRSAQIGFGIVFFSYILFLSRYKFFIFLISPIPLISGSFRYRLMTLNPFYSGDVVLATSANARGDQFRFLINYIYDNLILGVGQVPPPDMLRWLTKSGGNWHNTIDNFYLLYTWFYGLCGLFSWGLLMIMSLVKPVLLFKKKILQNELVILILSGIVAFCIINTVVALVSFQFIFWMYLGILTRLMYNYKNNV